MKTSPPTRILVLGVAICLLASGLLRAAEIKGTVRSVTGGTITVGLQGENVPNIGDKAEIYFKLAGMDDEVSVAAGIVVKIENASGSVEKDQRVRFTNGAAQVTPAGTKVSTSASPSDNGKSAAQPSIIGNWVGTYKSGMKYSFTFKDDQTFVLVINEKAASSDARIEMAVHGKYRLDNTAKPGRIEMFELDSPVQTLQTPFEFQGDSKLKMDLSTGAGEHPEKGFTDSATIFSRVP
jgi:hypothetical protein